MKSKRLIAAVLFAVLILAVIYIINKGILGEKGPTVFGKEAPAIEVIDAASGRKLSSSELRGNVLFVNFWATWCPPCRAEIPSIDRLSRRFMNDEKFVMLTILYKDDPRDAVYFLTQNGFNLPVISDPDGKAAAAYGVTGVPETYIVDKKGMLRDKVIGPMEWDSEESAGLISQLLKE